MTEADTPSSVAGSSRAVRTGLQKRSTTIIGLAVGLGFTIAFYLVAPSVAQMFDGGPVFVQRYFCGHPLEYITSAMFFVGMGILWAKLRQLPAERKAIRIVVDAAADAAFDKAGASSVMRRRLEETDRQLSDAHGHTAVGQRVHDVLQYVTGRPDGGLEDHLKYLADLAADRLLQSYSLIRTITWAVPIMGFLGTVVGITMAIANVTPEQLDSSLPEVTAGLAVAFDTTAQALGMSMILVFGTFLVERSEQSVLNDVEQFGIDRWLPGLAAVSEPAASPLTGMTDWTAQLLAEQTEAWSRRLASLQTGWAEALTLQTDTLAAALSEETESTLTAHRNSISGARDLYAATLQQSTHHFVSQLQQSMAAFCSRVDAWQNALQATSVSAASQAEELHALGRTLLQLTESEERLTHLQQQLNQNLETLQVVATLEQTVSSLNAAVNVLTTKSAFRAAA